MAAVLLVIFGYAAFPDEGRYPVLKVADPQSP